MPSFELGLEPLAPVKDTRICVYQHTHAHLSELFPKICMLTYDFEEYRYSELLLLLKTVIGLGDSPVWLNEENIRAKIFPADSPQRGILRIFLYLPRSIL